MSVLQVQMKTTFGRLQALDFNPFSAPACKIFRAERFPDARANSVFSDPTTRLLSMLCVLMKILSHATAKKKTKWLKGFIFCTFIGRF